uniref:Uncharacterized protein n=1 Tax=Opuntia streptacantha TaxID=393608 RepID=A0A7C9DCW2_OPUST
MMSQFPPFHMGLCKHLVSVATQSAKLKTLHFKFQSQAKEKKKKGKKFSISCENNEHNKSKRFSEKRNRGCRDDVIIIDKSFVHEVIFADLNDWATLLHTVLLM